MAASQVSTLCFEARRVEIVEKDEHAANTPLIDWSDAFRCYFMSKVLRSLHTRLKLCSLETWVYWPEGRITEVARWLHLKLVHERDEQTANTPLLS